MYSFQDNLLRIAGPFLFAVAFSAFMIMSGGLIDSMVTVREQLVQDEVYSQSNYVIDYDDNGIQNQDITSGVVNGSYLVGLICSGITVNTTIIDETDHTHKFRLTFDTKMMGTTYYTIEDTTLAGEQPVIEAYGSYRANAAFDFNTYLSPRAQYAIVYTYGDTGVIDNITFTRR